jgi:hypothetical protein
MTQIAADSVDIPKCTTMTGVPVSDQAQLSPRWAEGLKAVLSPPNYAALKRRSSTVLPMFHVAEERIAKDVNRVVAALWLVLALSAPLSYSFQVVGRHHPGGQGTKLPRKKVKKRN